MALVEETCGLPASESVFWPGREPMIVCVEHARALKGIAIVMGFHVASREAPPGAKCQNTPLRKRPDQ